MVSETNLTNTAKVENSKIYPSNFSGLKPLIGMSSERKKNSSLEPSRSTFYKTQ